MRIGRYLKVLWGSLLIAALAYGVLAAPGLLTDSTSTVPSIRHNPVVHP